MKPVHASFYSLKQEIDALALDPATRLGLRLAFFALGWQLITVAVFWHRLPPQVPLLFSRPYGETQLVSNFWLWLLPGLILIIELISIHLATKAKVENSLWSQLLAWNGAVAAGMGLITLIKIIHLIT
jgi:hypothetical protein